MNEITNVDLTQLHTLHMHDLRTLARNAGVAKTLELSRTELSESIKAKYKENNNSQQIFPSVFDVFYNQLYSKNPSLLAKPQKVTGVASASENNSRMVSGFVHVKTTGGGILFGEDLRTYSISLMTTATQALQTGDFVESFIGPNEWNEEVVRTIKLVTYENKPRRFKAAETTSESRLLTMANKVIHAGKRTIIQTEKAFDRVSDLLKLCKSITADTKKIYKIALLLDEDEMNITQLKKHADEVFVPPADGTKTHQVFLCLYSLFKAQHFAVKGYDVVFFVDNLSKLVKLYNHSVTPDELYAPTHFNLGAINDIKQFLLSARTLRDGGSFTPILYTNRPACSDIDYKVHQEFSDLYQQIIEK